MRRTWRAGRRKAARFFAAATLFFLSDMAARPAAAEGEAADVFRVPEAESDASATLVIFNDADPASRELAAFYAEKRKIPAEHVLGLTCSLKEEISRAEYESSIVEPLRRAFTANFWWKLRAPDSPLGPVEANKVRFIALMRGLPLKIAPAPDFPGDSPAGPPPIGTRNEAAVDSELATLGFFRKTISGASNNPYFRSYTRMADLGRPEVMLVCRLDGPSDEIVRRMITDGLAAEENGVPGFVYVDARGIKDAGLKEGDEWMANIAESSRRAGRPVILDNGPEMFPEGYPMGRAAFYYGWYAWGVAGPFLRKDFRFVPGAVAVHIHSFSAATVRDAHQNWVGPLLAAGAAATTGNVYEPYLTLTPHLDVLQDRLRNGYTFAEAAYMSERVLSWMTTFVGDPLYRPFSGAVIGEEKPASGEWAAYRTGAKTWFGGDRPKAEAQLNDAGRQLSSGVIFEGLGLLEITAGKGDKAIAAFRRARSFYRQPDDITRCAIHELFQLREAKRGAETPALARKMIGTFPDAPAVSVLRIFDPPLATPPPGTP